MTKEEKEIQELRRELDWLMQSEAIRSIAEKDEFGNHKNNIKGLDTCIQTLHTRARKAEASLKAAQAEAQTLRAENVRLRRQIEALADAAAVGTSIARPSPETDPSTDDERRFPLFG